MNLKLQVLSLIFSFVFGYFFSLLVNINYKLLFNKNKIIKYLGTFFFVIDMSLIYFLCIYKINNGILHPYFLILFILGFFVSYPINSKIRK